MAAIANFFADCFASSCLWVVQLGKYEKGVDTGWFRRHFAITNLALCPRPVVPAEAVRLYVVGVIFLPCMQVNVSNDSRSDQVCYY